MSHPEVFSGRPRVAVACGCALGEGPIWDHRSGTLHWVDIKAHALWSWQPESGAEPTRRVLGEPVGFVVLTPDPAVVLLGLKSSLAHYDIRNGRLTTLLDTEPDRPGNRSNDAGVGPDGSLYFGTMDDAEKHPSGRFYAWGAGGLTPFGESTIVTNGPTIDAAARVLYATDTTAGRIYRHPLGADGRPGAGDLFVAFEAGWGHPDGSTVDAEGYLWVCHFGGSRVTRFSPDGRAVLDLPVPTAQVSKVAFGGPDLGTLYITTAAQGRDREIDPLAGELFAVETGIRGRPAEICTMGRS